MGLKGVSNIQCSPHLEPDSSKLQSAADEKMAYSEISSSKTSNFGIKMRGCNA